MFAGHIGAGLAIGRAEPRVNVGVFIAAALLLDVLLWVFVLLGWESVSIPADFADTHQAVFTFPYSHGLLASLFWSAFAGAFGFFIYSSVAAKWRVVALVAAAVLSHWALDAIVHRPELPLLGPASRSVGVGLWNHMRAALGLEATIVIVGLWLFISGTALTRARSLALVGLTLLTLAFTAAGMTLAPAPPSAAALASGSLATLALVCAAAYWCGRLPSRV
jgi:hypothetical protein